MREYLTWTLANLEESFGLSRFQALGGARGADVGEKRIGLYLLPGMCCYEILILVSLLDHHPHPEAHRSLISKAKNEVQKEKKSPYLCLFE